LKLILSIAAGVALALVGLAIAFWLASTAIAWLFPVYTGRVNLRNNLRALRLPPDAVDRATLDAAATLAWKVSKFQGRPRMAHYTSLLQLYAGAIADSKQGFAEDQFDAYRTAWEAIVSERDRK
jgi:hypothetical protein